MAKFCGKDFLVQLLTTPPSTFSTVAGMRSTAMTLNKEQVDVTDKGDVPWRAALAGCGVKSMEITLSGFFTDHATLEDLIDLFVNGTAQETFKLISGAGDTFQGLFDITSLERTGEYNNAEQYSISLASAGPITYTAAP